MQDKIDNSSVLTRASCVLLACLQNMTMGGVFFGWSSISVTLLISSEGGPGLSVVQVQDIYVAGTFASSMGPLVLGIVLDLYGPRACSLLSISLISIGFLLFSYSEETTFNFFSLSMCLIAFGGPGSQSAMYVNLNNIIIYFSTVLQYI
jgi:nitrate/nitrite transporter NarK